jgi:hypothetical protein
MDESGKGKNVGALIGTPGLTLFTTLGGGPIRALFGGDRRLFAVSGGNFYEIFADGTANNRGSVANDGKPAYILANGTQVLIVSGGLVYCDNGAGPVQVFFVNPFAGTVTTLGIVVSWASGDLFDPALAGEPITINGVNYTVAQVDSPTQLELTSSAGTQAAVPYSVAGVPVTATYGTFLDEYFIINQSPISKNFNLSNLPPIGGLGWDPTDQSTKEGFPDNVNAVYADHEELWVFGNEQSTEVWQDTGNALNPFQRIDAYQIHYGCQAPGSISRLNNGIAWICIDQSRGGAFAVYAEGFRPQRVSTFAVENDWNSYATVADAISFTYIEEGHHFWVISFPTANRTWVYDATTGFWHRRGWWNGMSNDRIRQAFHAYVDLVAHGGSGARPAQHYVGDWQNGKIYTQSLGVLQDAGTQITRQRASPYVSNTGSKRMFFNRFELLAQVGTGGNPNGLNLYPALDWSDDGGRNWSNQHFPRTSLASTKARLVYPRLGSSEFDGRVFRITITDNAPVILVQATVEGTPGTA